jgi:hypothetical protein
MKKVIIMLVVGVADEAALLSYAAGQAAAWGLNAEDVPDVGTAACEALGVNAPPGVGLEILGSSVRVV